MFELARRKFLWVFCGAAVAWSFAARAQQPAMPVAGLLGASSLRENEPYTAAFLRGLDDTGFVAGQNVAIEYRWAEGDYDRLPAMAGDLVARRFAVIFASSGQGPLRAANRGDHYDSNRLQPCFRSRQQRLRRKPQSTGRQRQRV